MRPDLHWAFAGWGRCDPDGWSLPNVSVHRGRSGKELASLYRAADLLVLPSKSEGFPLVVQEALACGLQPVCCDDGASADPAAAAHIKSIPNEGTEAEIVTRYLGAIDELISQQDSELGRSIRAGFARERYAWDAAAKRYQAVIRSLAQGSKLIGRREEAVA
jgi:glycosyltransferase involved in cell wall biosynthesis